MDVNHYYHYHSFVCIYIYIYVYIYICRWKYDIQIGLLIYLSLPGIAIELLGLLVYLASHLLDLLPAGPVAPYWHRLVLPDPGLPDALGHPCPC